MPSEMAPAYLIAGTDEAKIDASRARLRARAETEGGVTALEVFEPLEGRGAPDADRLLSAIPAMSLTPSRRYLLADGVERWKAADRDAVAAALLALPPEVTVVLIAHGEAHESLAKAVRGAGGEVRSYQAPTSRSMPGHLVAEAKRRGFRLEPAAAQLLVSRMGAGPVRLSHELDRLALWAGDGGEVSAADLDSMVADTSEAAVWSLSDALLEHDAARALAIAERLLGQGESVTGLIYALASRLRKAHLALVAIERGDPPKQVERSLGMHPYAAKRLISTVRNTTLEDVRSASTALADLEVWCRGGADYGDELAFTLALRRATASVA